MNSRTMSLIALGSLLGAGAVARVRVEPTVTYQGSIMSRDVLKANGKTYVSLADVAKALGGHVAAHGTSYEIVSGSSSEGSGGSRNAPGGANEVKGQNGKVGDWFFNGQWRFQAKTVERTNEYHYRYYASSGTDKPDGNNDELVVITCIMKNGQQQSSQPTLTKYGLAAQKTALTDDQGQSYAPSDFDVRGGPLAPGAAKTFAVVFSVPKGTHLKDMIFSLYGTGADYKVTNIRVAMPDP
jgi:hypothetical protein